MRATEYMVHACNPQSLTVHSLMEDDVYMIAPDTTGAKVADILTEHHFGSVPVVDHERNLLGIVSEFDLLHAMEEGKNLKTIMAAEIMTRTVVTVTEDMPIMDLVHLLQERHLIRVPVVKGRTLIGIVARRDILFGYVKATSIYWP